jgi:DNA polymerase-3 subunit psi
MYSRAGVTPDQVLQLTPERVAMLPQDSRCNSWRLGTEAPLLLAGARCPRPLLMNSDQRACAQGAMATNLRT